MQKESDAIALIEEAAAEPSLDELRRRARAVLALAAPTKPDMAVMVKYWRTQRAMWGAKKEETEE